MTIKDIITEVSLLAGSYSKATFKRDAKALGIAPIASAIVTTPRQYPNNTARNILKARGYDLRSYWRARQAKQMPPMDTAASALENIRRTAEQDRDFEIIDKVATAFEKAGRKSKLVSPARLKAEKRKGKATR